MLNFSVAAGVVEADASKRNSSGSSQVLLLFVGAPENYE
jgi:hypothetical protein